MSDDNQKLLSELTEIRQALTAAQTRITELEAHTAHEQMLFSGLRKYDLPHYQAFDNLLEGCQIIGFDWRYLYLNAAAVRYGRRSKDDLLGYTVMERYPGIETTDMFAVMQQCMETRTAQDAEFEFTYPDGSQAWFEFRIQPVPEGIFILTLDVTERKQAEEELVRYRDHLADLVERRTAELNSAKEQVEAILNNNLDAILLVHPNLQIQQTNPAFEKLFGCVANEYSNRSLIELVHADDAGQVTTFFQECIAEQKGSQLEIRARREDGTVFDAELSIGYIKGDGLVCNIYDITARKQAQKALAEERNLLRTLIDTIPDYIYVKDTQHRFVVSNVAHALARGFASPDEIIGKTDFDFFPTELAEQFQAEEAAILRTGKPLIDHEQPSKGNIGGFEWAVSSKVPLKDLNGVLTGLVGITRDITERKKQERQLRYNASLQENVTDAVIATDLEFRIQSWNPAAERIYGWGAAEVMGKPVDQVLQTTFTSDETVEDVLQDFLEKGYWTGEVIQNHKGGRAIHILSSTVMFKDEHEQPIGIVAVNHDITERKNAQLALQRYADEVHDLYNNAPCGYHSLDKNGLIIQINDTELEWLGYTRDEVVGKMRIADIFTPESVQRFQANFPAFKERGWVYDLEFDVVCRDGSIMHILLNGTAIYDEDGQYLRSRSTIFDISDLRQTQAALREQHDFLQLVIDSVPNLILVKGQDGRFQMVNNRAAEVYGITAVEMVGKTDADLNLNQDEVEFLGQKDREVLESGQSIFIPEELITGRYYQTTKIPMKNSDGQVDRLLVVASDITARKQAEEILHQSLEKEKELNDLKTRFVSMASHEFRTPLATILAMTETLVAYRHRLPEEQIEKRLGKIQEQVEHLKDIMDDVLQLARIQARRIVFNPVKLDLDSLCRSVIDEFQSRPSITHHIQYSCDEALHLVWLDKKLMRQIINNLLSNAIKYSLDGTFVEVSLKYRNKTLILRVRDEGIGIPEEDLKYLFEPFHRAANVGAIAGTGLGLVIIKESVELHSGTIIVESQVGVGTTFTVNIPLISGGEKEHDQNSGDRR